VIVGTSVSRGPHQKKKTSKKVEKISEKLRRNAKKARRASFEELLMMAPVIE
jgi:hypothetical protein